MDPNKEGARPKVQYYALTFSDEEREVLKWEEGRRFWSNAELLLRREKTLQRAAVRSLPGSKK